MNAKAIEKTELNKILEAAAEYAANNFDCSKSSMVKYGHCKDYKLERCND